MVEELKLMESEACYRLEATLRIIKWGLDKRSQGIDLTTIDHHLYFQELTEGKLSPERDNTSSPYDRKVMFLEAKIAELTQENDRLKAELCLKHS